MDGIGRRLLLGLVVLAVLAGVAAAHAGSYPGPNFRLPCCFRPPGDPPPPGPPGPFVSEPTCAPEDGWWSLAGEEFLAPASRRGIPGGEPAFLRDRVLRSRAVAVLIEAATSDVRGDLRPGLILALASVAASGNVPRPAIRAHLESTLADTGEPERVRFACALGLGLLRDGSRRGLAIMTGVLNDSANPPTLRAGAALALGMLRLEPGAPGYALVTCALDHAAWDAAESLGEKTVDVAACALLAIGISRDPSALAQLLDRVRTSGLASACASASVAMICETHPDRRTDEIVDVLLAACRTEEPVARRGAIVALGRIARVGELPEGTRSRIVRTLLEHSFSTEETSATAALIALGRATGRMFDANGRRAARARLETVLHEGPKTRRPYAAIALGIVSRGPALGHREHERIRSVLRAAMGTWSGRPRDRGACAVALGAAGGPDAVADLVGAMRSKGARGPFHVAAITALGLAGDPGARSHLHAVLGGDNCCDRRAAAALACRMLGDPAPASLVLSTHRRGSSSRHSHCAKRLRALGAAAIPAALEPLLAIVERDSRDRLSRSKAVSAVAALLGRSGRPNLATFTTDIDHHLRSTALRWLPTSP